MIGPEHLSGISFGTGIAVAAAGSFTMLRPDTAIAWAKSFPRSRFWGVLLTAFAILWSAIMIDRMTLGELSKYKQLLYVLTPLSFYLIIRYLDELLAPRALGGLFMLFPAIMLDAARWHPSPWRLVVATIAYLMVIKGIWLMLCPFRFRTWSTLILEHKARRVMGAAASLAISVLLVLTALFTR